MTAAVEASSPKPDAYYGWLNEDLLELVPAESRRVLDVGCGAAEFGRELKKRRPDLVVHGIDRASVALDGARAHLDRVFAVDLDLDLPPLDGPYDTIIFGDVLEHLVDPWGVLRRLVPLLAPNGRVMASIPNLRFYRVLKDLVFKGRFAYRQSGVLDVTHLRFFTRHEMDRLLEGAGLQVVTARPRLRGNLFLRCADAMLFGALEEFRAYQYLLVARRTGDAPTT